jgi:hypothetical protein
MAMTRQEVIAQWRGQETKETASLVVEDKALQKLLAAWPMVPLVVEGHPVFAEEATGCWDALWEGVTIDLAAVSALSGLQQGPATVAFQRAKGLRLIYPDGTIHAMSKLVLQARIREAFPAQRKVAKS